MDIRCIGCGFRPDDIREFVEAARDTGLTPTQYVQEEEGTYNHLNGHFVCTACYITMGAPSTPYGWKAP